MDRILGASLLSIWIVIGFGCASDYQAFPPEAQTGLNKTVSFPQMRESPLSFQGTLMMIGGEVLSAKRQKDYTRLTILQLPLRDSQDPDTDRTQSQGRFIALQHDFLDPATLPTRTRVTLIGEVSGAKTEMLDEMEYTYPTITIKHLRVWPDPMSPPYWYGGYPYYPYWPGPYYAGPYWGPYFGPYGPYGWGGGPRFYW